MKVINMDKNFQIPKKWILIWIIILFVIVLLSKSFFIVRPWERAFTVTLWKIGTTIYEDWFHLKNPFITKVVLFDVQTQKFETMTHASSKDLQTVNTTVVLNYAFGPESVINLYENIGNKETIENKIINPAVQEVIKAVSAMYNAEWLITERSSVSQDIIVALDERLSKLGIQVQAFNITNFEFSSSFDAAVERKVTAEQDALAQKNKLEQVKYEAEQRIAQAQAEAEAIKIQAQAIMNQWWSNYVQLKRVEKWDWKLPTYVAWDSANLFMPVK